MLVCGLLAGLAFAMAIDKVLPEATAQSLLEPGADGRDTADESQAMRRLPGSREEVMLSYAPLVQQVAPAVVNIYTARRVQSRSRSAFFDEFFGRGRMSAPPRTQQSLGSGVIVGQDGLIITNNHVVDGAEQILVSLADRREYAAKLVFTDAQLDLALLQVSTEGVQLPTVDFGDSERTEVGDIVVAIGNPFGVGQTVTSGIISAVARTGVGISDYQFFLQTDAAINPGNSGGALIGLDGTLVGVNTAIYSRSGGSNGIGFAIPVNMVRQFLAGAKTGRIVRPWLGADTQAVTRELAASLGLDRPSGVLIRKVSVGGPAAKAGLRVGDIVTAINGQAATDPGTLRYLAGSRPLGEVVQFSVLRGDRELSVDLRLIEPPESPPRDETMLTGNHILTGVQVANLSPRLASELGTDLPESGVIVTGLTRGAPAARLNFVRTGDIIESVNDQAITSVDGLETAVAGTSTEARVRFSRGGQMAECVFQAPRFFRCRS
ncbi:Do family serine endopeptidase [Pacificimonas sp. WHA3]|uniref:Do family serine endopeptidase n=2 Tax=Pacificimonas pallii TaxID=2827236 RepID=A0ABS6SBK6_9SPHN|nr:Do family serine endopeptidase [Pacificimonas pallii]